VKLLVKAKVNFDKAWDILKNGIEDIKAFPCAVAMVTKGRAVLGSGAFGRHSYDAESPEVSLSSLFDLASVSKTMVSAGFMVLVERGLVDVTDRVGNYLKGIPKDKADLTIDQLLTHTSGLPSNPQLHEVFSTKETLTDAIHNVEPAYASGSKVLYTSMGFQLIREIIEAVTGLSLNLFLDESIFQPCHMTMTCFLPSERLWSRVVPTEYSRFRGRVLQGEVHDDNCYIMGGVDGHTGIFSSVIDVSLFGRMLANGGSALNGRRVMSEQTLSMMFANRTPHLNERRSLGWAINMEQLGSQWPDGMTRVGHTGFTGTSICIVPKEKISIVLLTNRVCPTRDNELITKVRPAFHEAVAKALFDK